MGLDVGDARIGLATGDTESHIAVPVGALARTTIEEDLRQLGGIAREREISLFVVGMPYSMNGKIGPQAEVTLTFIDRLASSLATDVVTVDERLTSVEAERLIRERPRTRRGQRTRPEKGEIDIGAAVLILQIWFDSYWMEKTLPSDG